MERLQENITRQQSGFCRNVSMTVECRLNCLNQCNQLRRKTSRLETYASVQPDLIIYGNTVHSSTTVNIPLVTPALPT